MKSFDPPHRPTAIWNATVIVLSLAAASMGVALTQAAFYVHGVFRVGLLFLALQAFLVSLVIFYARYVEPFWIAVTRKKIQTTHPLKLRVAVIGDFHVGPYKQEQFVARVAKRVNELQPDLILLVGDFLFDSDSDVEHLRPLEKLQANLGVFAVVGNHDSSSDHLPGKTKHVQLVDRSDDIVNFLEPLGIKFLRNTSIQLQMENHPLIVAGIDDVWMESCSLPKAMRNVPRGATCILLSHNPDIILDPASHRADLIVSGHTHGGQVRLPWLGALCVLPQRISQAFDRGIFRINERCTLAVTHGIGEMHVPLRLFTRPEILLLEIG